MISLSKSSSFFLSVFPWSSENLFWKWVLAANINVSPALTSSPSVVIQKMIYISSCLTLSHSQWRKAEIVWLRASGNLDGFWAFQSSVQSTHKYVVVVEHPAATANTAQHRPFSLHPGCLLFLFVCTFNIKEAVLWMCVLQLCGKLEIILLLSCCPVPESKGCEKH